MSNTDKIYSVALVYAQKMGKELKITDDLISNMQNDLSKLATEYAVNDTYNYFKEVE